MKFRIVFLLLFAFLLSSALPAAAQYATGPRFKVLAFYSRNVEGAHYEFALDALAYFERLNAGDGFIFHKTMDFADLNDEKLKDYDLVIWLNNVPRDPAQREAFRRYMENGGGWLGFHVSAYNDKNTNWPWFRDFLGCGVFWRNNWPAQPVKVVVERDHPVTRALPPAFIAPESEWYQWTPSPRENPDVEVLVSISPDNYPLGIKDIIDGGDFPIVWTNTRYRMVYLNMGHGGTEFTDATQNLLVINAFRWVLSADKKGDPFTIQRHYEK